MEITTLTRSFPGRGRSSPSISDSVSSAIEWICTTNYLVAVLMHLLDEFLSVKPPHKKLTALKLLMEIFERLGVLLVPHKILAQPRSWNFWALFSILSRWRFVTPQRRLRSSRLSSLLSSAIERVQSMNSSTC